MPEIRKNKQSLNQVQFIVSVRDWSPRIRELKREMDKTTIPIQQQATIINLITHEIPNIKFFEPDGNPDPLWRIFRGESLYSAWMALQQYGVADMFDSYEKSKPVKFISKKIEEALNDPKTLRRETAIHIAANEACKAANDVLPQTDYSMSELTRVITNASASMCEIASIIMIEDLEFPYKEEIIKYLRESMKAWKKGYGVELHFNGEMHVFLKENSEPSRILPRT